MDKIIGFIIVAFGMFLTLLVAVFVWALRFGIIAFALYVLYKIGQYFFMGA